VGRNPFQRTIARCRPMETREAAIPWSTRQRPTRGQSAAREKNLLEPRDSMRPRVVRSASITARCPRALVLGADRSLSSSRPAPWTRNHEGPSAATSRNQT
jgi:hypothetical protein